MDEQSPRTHAPPDAWPPPNLGAPLGAPEPGTSPWGPGWAPPAPGLASADPGPPVPPHRARRRWRWLRALLALVVLVVAAAIVADHIHLDEYAITPGVAQPVGPLVSVPAARAHRVKGKVLLTDVYLTAVTALSYFAYRFDGDATLIPAGTLLGPATPADELIEQGFLEMAQSQDAAKAAALTRLGYDVHATSGGTLIFAVTQGSPATGHLKVAQIVHAVDGSPTPTACSFSKALGSYRAGQTVQLAVERSIVTSKAAIRAGKTVVEDIRLGHWPSSVPKPTTSRCAGTAGRERGYLGVEAETAQTFRFPFRVSISTTTIGGPSAGLAMTLGIIDTLSGGELTGGRTVAATGTIAPTGAVGEVGGIPQKTVAVEHAGATVFFVPAGQVATALSKATPSLRVVGVTTLTQALKELGKLGGTVPPPPGS